MTYLTRIFRRRPPVAKDKTAERSGGDFAMLFLLALVFVPIVGVHIAFSHQPAFAAEIIAAMR